jgi:general secretion pathway protein C
MSTLLVRLVSLLLFAVLCAVSTYWFIVLSGRERVIAATVTPPAPLSTAAAGELFGGSTALATRQDYKIVGILSLGPGQGAAAIIASTDGPTHTLAAGQLIDGQTRLTEVREHSVILERSGVKSEIFLPVAVQSNGYLR